ncbi:hypothetical protein ACEQPO_30490 [Bacillus sp. SL00103]
MIRVVAYSSLINKDINADLANDEALKDIIPFPVEAQGSLQLKIFKEL